jgi:SAM-dependent methyltransferase
MVERFAARDPDHRLARLVTDYPNPPAVRVLDLGCAAGRNAVLLAQLGFDVIAIDFSKAMVKETRRRVADILGPTEAEARVRIGGMTDLEDLADGSIDLIVALGIYHGASSRREWDRALEESARVLARGGRILVANHTEEFDPAGKGVVPVPGEPHLYDGLASGRSFLVDALTLDREIERHGLRPFVPTQTVRRETEAGGRRVTANALYLKP